MRILKWTFDYYFLKLFPLWDKCQIVKLTLGDMVKVHDRPGQSKGHWRSNVFTVI